MTAWIGLDLDKNVRRDLWNNLPECYNININFIQRVWKAWLYFIILDLKIDLWYADLISKKMKIDSVMFVE